MYYIYLLRCQDNSIYTGITTDIQRRMQEHFSKGEKCAKYTFRHTAQKLEKVWQTQTRADASKLEYHIKTLKKEEKENLVADHKNLEEVLKDKIEPDLYEVVERKGEDK